MKITEEILEAIGFIKLCNSSNPEYYYLPVNYFLPSKTYNKDKERIILGKESHGGKPFWSLRVDRGDCASFVKEIQTLNQIVCVISEFAFDLGDKSRKIKFKQALED